MPPPIRGGAEKKLAGNILTKPATEIYNFVYLVRKVVYSYSFK